MKGKKLMAMLMAGSLLLAGLTGCGGAKVKCVTVHKIQAVFLDAFTDFFCRCSRAAPA